MSAPGENILDALPAACASIDGQGRLVWTNLAWRRLFADGTADDETAGIPEWFPEEPSVHAVLREAAAARAAVRLRARRRNGVPFTIMLLAAEADTQGGIICVGREVAGTELLSESQRYLDVAFEIAPLGMALFDTDGRYLRVNQALCDLLGRTSEELIGRRDQEFTHPDDRAADVDAAWRILNGEMDAWQTEKRFITADGGVVWTIANLTFLRDPDGRPLSWLGQFQNITQRRQREELLGHLAVHDELTGVANRRGLIQELGNRLAHARRYEEPGAVMVLDLDGFKEINDRDGHQAGDAVLARVAQALQARLRITDFLARLGGDEFAVILPHADAGSAETVGEDLLRSVRDLESGELCASCGIVLYDGRSAEVDSILADADRAMYTAKARGGNSISIREATRATDAPSER